MTPDQINGAFEAAGALFTFMNIVRLHRDKMVRGVHWLPIAFFTSWGFWNLYYYPHLDQWWSFAGGIGIVVFNTIWLAQMWYYIREERNVGKPKFKGLLP